MEYNNDTKRYLYVQWVDVSTNIRASIQVNTTATEARVCGRNNTIEGFSELFEEN